MVEFPKDSTNINPGKEKANISVKEDKTLNNTSFSCDLGLEEDRAVWSEELFRIFGLKPQPYGPNVNNYVARDSPPRQGNNR